MQRLVDMSTSELIQTATQYSASIKEIGIYSELVKELTTRLGANTAAVTQALKERGEARLELSSAQLTISQITKVMGASETLSISEQVSALNQQVVNLAVENANARSAITVFSDATEQLTEIIGDEIGMDGVAKILAGFDAVGNMPATDAAIANIRASEAKEIYESILDNPAVTDMGSLVDWIESYANNSVYHAAQLRKEAGK